MLSSYLRAFILTVIPISATGHEFWIDPLRWIIPEGEMIEAHIRQGQDLKGATLPYIPNATRRIEIAGPSGLRPVDAIVGDRPAFAAVAQQGGLHTLIYVTADTNLVYSEYEKFEVFVKNKSLGDTLERHHERGLHRTQFIERYSRYSKSLVAVGDGGGSDREFGLLTELTALANPYTDDTSAGVPVKLTYQASPRINEQIQIFDRDPAGAVTVTTTRTDTAGRALIPVTPGHSYMLDAVVMRPLGAETARDPVWESLWANLTFHVPPD